MSGDDYQNIYAPLYDLRILMTNDSGIYSFLFDLAIILVIIAINVLILVYERKRRRLLDYEVLIMNAQGLNGAKIKATSLLIKALIFLIGLFIASSLGYLLKKHYFESVVLTVTEYLLLVFLLAELYLNFLLTNVIFAKKDLDLIKRQE